MRFPNARFSLGHLVSTSAALKAFEAAGETPIPYLARHASGDWGEVDKEDKRANDRALKEGTRLLSAYTLTSGTKLWIITEADRSSTCILLPDDY